LKTGQEKAARSNKWLTIDGKISTFWFVAAAGSTGEVGI